MSRRMKREFLTKPEYVFSKLLKLRKASVTTRNTVWKDGTFKRHLERVGNFIVRANFYPAAITLTVLAVLCHPKTLAVAFLFPSFRVCKKLF